MAESPKPEVIGRVASALYPALFMRCDAIEDIVPKMDAMTQENHEMFRRLFDSYPEDVAEPPPRNQHTGTRTMMSAKRHTKNGGRRGTRSGPLPNG